MKTAIVLIVALLLGAYTEAQTARVIQLSPEDAAKAKSLFEQKAAIDRQIEDLQEKIRTQYIKGQERDTTWVLNGFEYSQDFKFIVPKVAWTQNTCGGIWAPGSIVTTPVTYGGTR